MADIEFPVAGLANKKLKDMGDGTHAEVVALATTPTIDIGDVQVLAGSAIIGKVGIDQTTPGTTDRVTAGGTTCVDVTPSLDTNVLASGDLIADTEAIAGVMRVADFGAVLQSLVVVDKDDQKAAFDIYFLSANVAMGTENSAPSISDANAVNILGVVPIATADYKDLGGVSVATIKSVGLVLKPASGTTTVYVAIVNGSGTPTYTASGLVLRLGVLRD